MPSHTQTDVLIIGGSYAGLAAAMSLGRALRRVIVLDSGQPCNRQTPHSHNFLTQDGETPAAIRAKSLAQVLAYNTVTYQQGVAVSAQPRGIGFSVTTAGGATIAARKLIFATGIHDLMPGLPGFAECWGVSVLHCPYCHGYEVRGQGLGVLSNGETAYDFVQLIRNWSASLTLFTNGPSTLTPSQTEQLSQQGVAIVEKELQALDHQGGQLQQLVLQDGSAQHLTALFARLPFVQHSALPTELGCELTAAGYVQVSEMQKTSVPGIYAAGDATTPMRAVAAAVASGSKAGAMVNHELIQEGYR